MGPILKIIKGSFDFWREGRPEEEKRETEKKICSSSTSMAGFIFFVALNSSMSS